MFFYFCAMPPVNPHTIAEATKKMERYCVYQERCPQEVFEKLKGMQLSLEDIDQIMAHLIQENYLNETRFAKSFARGKFHNKKWGRNRIVWELKQRNITTLNIKNALAEIEEEKYLDTLDELVQRKWIQITDTNLQKRKKKLADYLLYRGWEGHLVYEKLRELC